MIKTVKKETCKDAMELLTVIHQRRELERIEKKLKEKFKELLGSEVAIDADGILISIDERERTNLDKKALSEVIDLSKFETKTTYNVMSVKKVG